MGGFPVRLKPFVFGRDEFLPEAEEEKDRFLQRANRLGLTLAGREKEPAIPDLPPITAPTEPQLEALPDVAPQGLKETLKRALLGMIPGFQQGFEKEVAGETERRKYRNTAAQKQYSEDMDRYLAETRERRMTARDTALDEARTQNLEQRMAIARMVDQAKIEKLEFERQQQMFREQQKFQEFMQKSQFFESIMVPMLRQGGTPEDSITRSRLQFMSALGSNPFDDKIQSVQKLLGRNLTEAEMLRVAGAAESGGGYSVTSGSGTWGPAEGDPSRMQFYPNPPSVTQRYGPGQTPVLPGTPEEPRTRPAPITAATRQLGETSKAIIPKMDSVITDLDKPEVQEKIGALAGRWQEFWTGDVGWGDPVYAKLRSTIGLLQTGAMRAHVGARGGQQLLAKFEGLFNAKHMDATTLKSSLEAVRDFLKGYRDAVYKPEEEKPAKVLRYDRNGNRVP